MRKTLSVLFASAMLVPSLAFAQTPAAGVKAHTYVGIVAGINGNTINLNASNAGSYTVDASNAKLIRRYGAAMQIADIQTGDQLEVRGTASGTAISATQIRDTSLQAKHGTFSGTVTAVSSTGFTLQSKNRSVQTVNVNSSTVYNKNGQADANGLADVVVGSSVVVNGVWNRANNNITATKVNLVIRQLAIRVSGTLQGISGNSLTVAATNGTTYTADATSAKVYYKNGHSGDLSILAVGDSVVVAGKHQKDSTSITASWVRDTSKTFSTGTPSSISQ